MAINDIYRLSVEGISVAGTELVNVHYYRQVGSPGGDDGMQLALDWYSTVGAAYMAACSAGVAMVGFKARNLTQPQFGVDYALPAPLNGSITGDSLPPQDTAVIRWTTGLIGKRRRGRTYMWPTGESQQSAGQLIPAHLTLLSVIATVLPNPAGVGSWQKVIYSPPTPTDATTIVTDVTGGNADVYIRGQRRRQVGVGS